jgi:hypothetical protein
MIKLIACFIFGSICISCGGEDPEPTPQKTTTVVVGVPTNTIPAREGSYSSGQESSVQNDHCMASDCNEKDLTDPRHRDPVDEIVQTKFNVHQVVIPKP